MNNKNRPAFGPNKAILLGIVVAAVVIAGVGLLAGWGTPAPSVLSEPDPSTAVARVSSTGTATPSPAESRPTITPSKTLTSLPTSTPTVSRTPTPTPTPTDTPTPTVTPTSTLDLSRCNAAGCGKEARTLPPIEDDGNLLLTSQPPTRRLCKECPHNPHFSEPELNRLVGADRATLARLETIARSQTSHEIAPGVVYIVFDNVHHVVIDLAESGYVLRNIIPEAERGTLITPSYCLSPNSLVVVDADYHGLNGSNKTETGRDLFFHLGRAALFQRDGQFDIDVMRAREEYDPTTISWGGGPIFIWEGAYNYNPKEEWFTQEDLDYYRDTKWAKMTVALSKDRKYLFLTASYGLTLKEHAENIMALGKTWGLNIDRAMRFDGGESTYLAIRLNNHMVPVLNLEEPLIVNCLAVEKVQ